MGAVEFGSWHAFDQNLWLYDTQFILTLLLLKGISKVNTTLVDAVVVCQDGYLARSENGIHLERG